MIRLLIVDDSAFMRTTLSQLLDAEPDITVVGTAKDGVEALEQARVLKPDVITMDVMMPNMDGISAVQRMMNVHSCPILMFSSLTQEGAETTLKALEAGATDFITKESSFVRGDRSSIVRDLVAKIKSIHGARSSILHNTRPLVSRARTAAAPAPAPTPGSAPNVRINGAELVLIGISTGGPLSLQKVIPMLAATFPVPIVIAQHMPPKFTKTLADSLNAISALTVVEATDGTPLKAGGVYIAPGGSDSVIFRKDGTPHLRVLKESATSRYHPCVDLLFTSAADLYGSMTVGVVMTGMGNDGLEGARHIKARNGTVLVQDEGSSVIYGMPKAVFDAGLADATLALDHIAPVLTRSLARATANAA
ncbi:MAG: chemotaxis response regulator protein-glutamate methylesterase [Rhodothermales bacterium]